MTWVRWGGKGCEWEWGGGILGTLQNSGGSGQRWPGGARAEIGGGSVKAREKVEGLSAKAKKAKPFLICHCLSPFSFHFLPSLFTCQLAFFYFQKNNLQLFFSFLLSFIFFFFNIFTTIIFTLQLFLI